MLGGDLVGMTGIPEATLAREKEMCYNSICIVSNYASGISENELTIDEVFEMVEKKVTVGGMPFSSIDVSLPKKELFYSFNGTYANTDAVINRFFELLSLLTQMASIRTIVWRLAEEVRKTQRRVNALDKMIIPQTQETKAYIESVLEERERDNTFVLKALKKRNGDN